MADNSGQKPGLTTFGWLALGGAAAAYFASPARREKLMTGAKGLMDKYAPKNAGAAEGTNSTTKA